MPKNVQATTQLHIFHMLIILQNRLQQYVNQELPYVQVGFIKGRGTKDQIANMHWIIEESREFQKKKSTSVLLTMPKPLCESQQPWKILKEMGIPDHLTCLLRKLFADQETTVRNRHGKPD